MKTKLMLILCSTVSIRVIAMNEKCHQIVLTNLLQHPVEVQQQKYHNSVAISHQIVAIPHQIESNTSQELPLLIDGKSVLSFLLPYCLPYKIMFELREDQKNIVIKKDPVVANKIVIEDEMQQLACATYTANKK